MPTPPKIPRWKRSIDILVSLGALPFLAVVMLVVAIITRIKSPGPVLFRQVRIGYRGERFTCYKIRTMVVSADPAPHRDHLTQIISSNLPLTKMDVGGDKRLIPGGWLLRASGLDELAQILNVLKGEMTLVGPRPCVPYEYALFPASARPRFSVLPGLTGLWQVSGKNRTTFSEMITFDVQYAGRVTFWGDLRIMWRTLPTLIGLVMDARPGGKPTLSSDALIATHVLTSSGTCDDAHNENQVGTSPMLGFKKIG